jgi:hypothetical protein
MSKTGYCSLCKHPKALALNNAIAAGKGYTVVSREMAEYGMKFAKTTFLTHKSHITSPLLTAAEEARKNPVIAPKSKRAVLEMIRDMGVQRAMEHPEEIGVNHALRAAKILQDAEGKQESVLIILAKSLMGPPPPEMIEGSYMELTTTEEVE